MTPSSFRFRLEPVRALRERAEDLAREELAAGLSRRAEGESSLHAAVAHLEEARGTHRQAVTMAPASVADLRAMQAYLERAETARRWAVIDLDRCAAEVEVRRAQLGEAARERQVLERLRERQQEAFRVERERVEGAILDELALNAHRRRDAGPEGGR